MNKLWLTLSILGVSGMLTGAGFLWGNSGKKAAIAQARQEAIDSVLSIPTTITLPDTVYVAQGHIPQTHALPPKPRQDEQTSAGSSPNMPFDTLGLPVVARTPFVLRDDTVQVKGLLMSSFDRRTLLFTHEFQGITVSYPREVHFIDLIEYRGPYWWEKPLLVLSTVGAAVCIQREEWAGAACFGAVGVTLLTVDF